MKVKKEYYRLKGKRRGFDRYHRIPNTPDFPSYNEACDFYRDHCNKGYYMMHIYESISVHKCFDVEDEFILQLKVTHTKGEFTHTKGELTPRPFEEEIKQTVANSRESAVAARNSTESKPYTL